MPRRAARQDQNHTALLRVARDIGAAIVDTHALPGALDVLIGYRGRLHLVEIKAPGKRDDLTAAERLTIARLARVGVAVPVVETADELLRAIGAIV